MLKQNRRDFMKASALAATAAAAGATVSPEIAAAAGSGGIRWDKGVCRFCGTGCGVLVGTKGGRVVATQGDPEAPVNRGLACIKGYFLAKIMYGQDRLTQPLLRKRGGVYDKDGDFEPVSWDEAFTVMAGKFKKALREKGPKAIGMFGSGQWTVWEGYAAAKLYKAGFRSNNHRSRTRATAWPRPWPPSSAASASTSRWVVTTTSNTPTPSCSGAPTWPRCTRSCGRG